MARVMEVAKRICEVGDWRVSNLKLQKLAYLAHMIHLGRHAQPLVNETFEAWDYGPVLPSLYREVKIFGSAPIKNIFRSVGPISDEAQRESVDEACSHFLHLPPAALVALTHQLGGAWAETYRPGSLGTPIPNAMILDEWKKRAAGEI